MASVNARAALWKRKNTSMNFEQKINYIERENFVRFTNCHAFADISSELKMFLQETGFYSDKMAYPYFTATGTLQSVSPKIIELASNRIGRKLCIDLNNNERLVVFNPQDGEVTVVNSNLKNYIECLYAMRYFSEEIEGEDVFGDYDTNAKKYARKLLELFNVIEGDIRSFPLWYIQVHEREIGTL